MKAVKLKINWGLKHSGFDTKESVFQKNTCSNSVSKIPKKRQVHDSSIEKWGYQDNFKPIYFFFLRKDFKRTKTQINQNQPTKTKISEQKTTKATVSCAHKNF